MLAIAVALRVWGLDWGLPTGQHYLSYHPDETVILNAASNVNVLGGEFDPRFYNYGSVFIYLVNIVMTVGMLAGSIHLGGDPASSVGGLARIYMGGRILAVVLGTLTIYAVYALGRRIYGKPVGLMAALLMAVAPLHVMYSKFMAVDVPATFFLVLSLIYAGRIPRDARTRNYILAGLFAGLAAATKYNAGLVLLSLLAVHAASIKGRPIIRVFDLRLLSGMLSAAAGFLIGCPGVVLNTKAFVRDFRFEMLHVSTGHGLVFAETGSGFLYHLTHSLLPGLGPALLLIGLIGVLYALAKARPLNGLARLLLPWRAQTPVPETAASDWMLIVFLAAYYAVIGAAEVRFARYVIPILPVIALLAARAIVELEQWLAQRNRFSAVAVTVVALLAIGYTAAYSAALDTLFAFRDTRDQAATWIKANVPEGSSIGMPTTPWFYTPPLLPDFGIADPAERLAAVDQSTDYVFVVDGRKEWNAQVFEEAAPDYAVVSEFEYRDRRRVGDPDYEAYASVLKRDYRLEKQFVRRPGLFGVRFPMQWDLPHDMSYASPETLVYSRRSPNGG